MTEKKLRTGIYLRVSSKSSEGMTEEEKRQTNENQRRRVEDWLTIRPEFGVYRWYADEDTGRDDDRPHYQEMKKDLQDDKLDVIIMLRIDRLFRKMSYLTALTDVLKEHSVRLIAFDNGIDMRATWDDPSTMFVIHIMGSVAELEDGLISLRTNDGLNRFRKENEEREKQGLPPKKIGRPPFGFAKNPDEHKTGEFIPIPEELHLAKEVVALRERHASLNEISQRTNIPVGTVNKIIKRWNFYKDYQI
jgi:DNA invertase Pin-like site-specific DNA recombinase